MIIEFFGVPGAGKTTGARHLSSEMKIPLLKEIENRIINVLRYTASHPQQVLFFFWVASWQTIRSQTWTLFRWRIATLLDTFSILARASRHPGDVVVDEGLLQRILSVYENVISKKQASRIAELLSPDFVVYLTGTTREFQRYDDPTHPRCKLGATYLDRWKHTVRENTTTLYRTFAMDGVSYIATDDSCDPRIIEAVRNMTSHR